MNVSAAARGDLGDLRTGLRGLKPSDFSKLWMTPVSGTVGKAALVTLSLKPEAWLGVPFLLGAQNELCPPERWMLWAGVPT